MSAIVFDAILSEDDPSFVCLEMFRNFGVFEMAYRHPVLRRVLNNHF